MNHNDGRRRPTNDTEGQRREGTRFGVALDPVLAERWFDLGTFAASTARGPRPSAANESLAAEAQSQPQSPLTPVYLLWIADNLAREGRNADAVAAYARALAAVDNAEPLGDQVDLRRATLQNMAGAYEHAGDPAAAINALRELAKLQPDDPDPLYQAGRLAENAGRAEDARDLYVAAADRSKSRRSDAPAELARRAAARLEEPDTAFRPTLAKLVAELTSAVEERDKTTLVAVRSRTHFAAGPIGGEMGFEASEVADSMLAELSADPVSVIRGVLGSGGKRYLRTRGWKGSRFRGDVFLVLSRSSRGWQWTGIGLAHPTEEWMSRWRPDKVEVNQPLPIALLAPWPAGQSFTAGGLADFIAKSATIAAAGLLGGAALAYLYSRNDCGFGTRGFYYNNAPTHDEENAFAIDFTRYKRGSPFNNVSGGTPVLAAAAGVVVGTRFSISSGDNSSPNEVEIMHPDPATGSGRFMSRYLHLAGPGLVPVSVYMPIMAGNRLGLMDDTGTSLLNHLHFSIHDQQVPYAGSGMGSSGIPRGASVRPTPMDGQTLGDGASGKCIRSSNVETQPPIWIDDIGDRSQFVSQHWVHTETADRLQLYTLTGIVILHLRGTGRDWLGGQVNLGITVPEIPPGFALRLVHWAPLVTINAISNDGTAVWAGWSVDWFRVARPGAPILRQVRVETGVAVRDSDGYLLRLGYEVTLAGTFVTVPVEPVVT